MKKRCVAMLLAGGQGSRLYALTQDVAKPIVPFGGKFRIVDFPLSNCANSGVDTVGVLTQYRPLKLNGYIGSGRAWDLANTFGGVSILPPYQVSGEKGSWFKGTANAIYQNMDFIDIYDPEYVLILSGDHIYKMDYSKMIDEHEKMGAACTIAVLKVPMEDASRFGIMSTGEDGYICKFTEKPKEPDSDLASMGIYVFTWSKLKEYLIADENTEGSENDFGKNVIPAMLGAGEKMWPYHFQGYWRDVGTIESLWDANMDVLSGSTIDLFDKNWPIRSNNPISLPMYLGRNANVVNSIITGGCNIQGTVKNSVLSASVTIEEGAEIISSVIMPGTVVHRGAVIQYSIVAGNSEIGAGAEIGAEPIDGQKKITTLGPDLKIAAGAKIEAGAMVYTNKAKGGEQ